MVVELSILVDANSDQEAAQTNLKNSIWVVDSHREITEQWQLAGEEQRIAIWGEKA